MTAYTVPVTDFAHGEYPNAVDLNTHSTAQEHLDEILPAYAEHPLSYYTSLDNYPSDESERFTNAGYWRVFTHTYRYLHYACDGSASRIMKYSPTLTTQATGDNWWGPTWLEDNSVSLSSTNGNADQIQVGVYDLDSIAWLDYGDQYVVYDCFGALEYDASMLPIEATPPFYDGNLLSAAALNSMGRNIESIKGRTDAPMRPRLIESDDHWFGLKVAGYLRIKGTILTDTVSSVAVYVGDNPSSMGSADFTLNNGGSGWAANAAFDSGSLSLAALSADQAYLVKIAETGSGTLRVQQIYMTDES